MKKKRILAMVMTLFMVMSTFVGCGGNGNEAQSGDGENSQQSGSSESMQESQQYNDSESVQAQDSENGSEADLTDDTVIRIGGLKGPTSMGMAKLLTDAGNGESRLNIEFTLAATADELTPSFVQGDLDLLAVPSNLASVLYNNTEGALRLLAVNTLGVLNIVDTGDSISSVEDLKEKTILATGQGNTPEYTLNYILTKNGIDPAADVTIEWKSEAAEIVAVMAASEGEVIAMLPQPYVTVAQTQVEGLRIALDLNTEWENTGAESGIVTGVMIARTAFVEEHPELIAAFLEEYQKSTEYVNANVSEAAQMIEALDIVKAAIAEKALPYCNITFMQDGEMKTAVSGYLQVLYDQNPKSVGGNLPDDAFYYTR